MYDVIRYNHQPLIIVINALSQYLNVPHANVVAIFKWPVGKKFLMWIINFCISVTAIVVISIATPLLHRSEFLLAIWWFFTLAKLQNLYFFHIRTVKGRDVTLLTVIVYKNKGCNSSVVKCMKKWNKWEVRRFKVTRFRQIRNDDLLVPASGKYVLRILLIKDASWATSMEDRSFVLKWLKLCFHAGIQERLQPTLQMVSKCLDFI